MLEQLVVERMSCQRGGIGQYYEFHAGPCHGYVHAAQVLEESYLTVFIGADQAYYYHVTLLSLKSVDRVYAYKTAVWLKEWVGLDELTQILHLCAVGAYESKVNMLLDYALTAYLADVILEVLYGKLRLRLVYASE